LQALVKSSEDSTTKTHRKMRKMPVSDRLALDEMLNKIKEMSEEEEITEETTGEIVLGPEFEEIKAKREGILKEASAKMEILISSLKEEIASKGQEETSFSVSEKAAKQSDQIFVEGSKKIAELTAADLEQLLCAADLFTEQVKTGGEVNFGEISLEENPNFPRIVYVLKLANDLHAEISQLSNSTISFLREVSAIAKSSSESNEGIDKKTSANVNALYLDTSSALSHVQDSKKIFTASLSDLCVRKHINTHFIHFYTERNLFVFSKININEYLCASEHKGLTNWQ